MTTEGTLDVELVYDADCPHVDATRRVLGEALAEVGLDPRWRERVQPPAAAGLDDDASRRPSPTVLVQGEDLEESPTGTGCRLYRDSDGRLVGAPPVERVVRALRDALGDREASP